MGEYKPLGSEKLNATDKLKRIIELSNYNYNNSSSVINETKSNSNVNLIVENKSGGVYGIVKEKNDYYVKKGLNESSLDYIGGMFMKNKNRFSSYAEAFKRLDLLKGQEELQEATKYVLKSKTPETEAPLPEAPTDTPISDEPPMDAPVDDMGGEVPMDEPVDDMGGESEGGKPSDYMSEVQKFSGKLGQELRDQKEKMESDDIKYVLNMIISAVNLDTLDEDDLNDIVSKFDRDTEEGMEDEESDTESTPEEEGEEDLSETDDNHYIDSLEEFINTPLEEEEENEEGGGDEVRNFKDLSKFADLSEEGDEDLDEEVELDLDAIKKEINDTIGQTLSKYFK